jgi:hypothetical protein
MLTVAVPLYVVTIVGLSVILKPVILCLCGALGNNFVMTVSRFIEQEASKGNPLTKQYIEKLRKEEVSIDWAHRVLIDSIRQQRILKMMAIADERHFRYDNEIELVQFIGSEMQKKD